MGKRTGGLLCVLLLALLPAGCQFIRIEEGERTPLEYTIVKTGTTYGIALYDHIALDGTKIDENQLIK